MNNNYYLLIILLIILFLANVILFYSIIGTSIVFYILIVLFVIFLIIICLHFLKRRTYPLRPFVSKLKPSLKQNTAIHNMQNKAYKMVEKDNFLFHKIIILIEAIIIVFLLINMLFKTIL